MTEFLAAVEALDLPGRPEYSPIFGLLIVYVVLASLSALGHVAAANFGNPRFNAVRIARGRTAAAVSLIFLGLALIVAGLPLGDYL
jgi:hypothetical protein